MNRNMFHQKKQQKVASMKKRTVPPIALVAAVLLLLCVAGFIFFLINYHPAPSAPAPTITLEQKMAYLDGTAPLPTPKADHTIPRWMLLLIVGFVMIQILPLVLAAYYARKKEFTSRELRLIEFLVETPLFLGLLGSLLGICMTQFISGTLAAPLAYLTTISGIVLYLLGRFTISVSVPSSHEATEE